MTTREYIGARYVPKFKVPLEHDPSIAYEPLTVVTSGAGTGSSYISRCYIEAGVQLTDPRWVLTYNYDAHVYALEQQVQQQSGRIDTNATAIAAEKTRAEAAEQANTALSNTKLSLAGGTMTGAIDMGGKKIAALAAPTAATDAANKKYVDDKTGDKLPLAGGTMTGAIDMGGKKITNLGVPTPNTTDCATTAWVSASFVNTNGYGSMSGHLNMGNNFIINLKSPVNDTDATTKKYVDDLTKLSPAAAAQGWQTIKIPTDTAKKYICIQLYATTVNKSVTKASDVNIYLTDILLAHKQFPKAYDNPPYEFCTVGCSDLDNAWAVKANSEMYPSKTQTGDYRGFTTVSITAQDWFVKYMAVGIVTEA